MFPNGDHQALAELMAALRDDEALRLSRAGRAREVVARFDEKGLLQRYLDLYEEVRFKPKS
jgi:glycosyltransferase involved in cell wall biosynthesis